MASKNILALDIGHKRIGVATANTAVPIAVPRPTIVVDGSDQQQIRDMITANRIDTLVVGYPRNQQGQPTAQTEFATQYAKAFADHVQIVYQDESLTSVAAEERLAARGGQHRKGDVDAEAAAIILQDYLEEYHG